MTSFLEDINNLLNSGEIPNLYDAEQKSELLDLVRALIKNEGVEVGDTLPQLYGFFVDKCKSLMHLTIAVSPIGDKFRNNIR